MYNFFFYSSVCHCSHSNSVVTGCQVSTVRPGGHSCRSHTPFYSHYLLNKYERAVGYFRKRSGTIGHDCAYTDASLNTPVCSQYYTLVYFNTPYKKDILRNNVQTVTWCMAKLCLCLRPRPALTPPLYYQPVNSPVTSCT